MLLEFTGEAVFGVREDFGIGIPSGLSSPLGLGLAGGDSESNEGSW